MEVPKELLTMDTYNLMPDKIMVILDKMARTTWPTMQKVGNEQYCKYIRDILIERRESILVMKINHGLLYTYMCIEVRGITNVMSNTEDPAHYHKRNNFIYSVSYLSMQSRKRGKLIIN